VTDPLPDEVARLLAATNAEDADAFLDAFTDDGVVDDWGRRFAGRERIAEWDAGENIGVHARIEATSVRRTGDTVEFGGGTFTATLRDGRVAELVIRG
jgi:ketosteroid isomerase-like protein